MDFKTQLKNDLLELVQKNDTYQHLVQELQQIRVEKQELESKVLDFLKQSNVQNKVFVLNDYKISQKRSWQYQQLSLKYIETCLKQYCVMKEDDSFQIEEFMEFMKQRRDKKAKEELKIS
tara:strand:- start:240 stop:599 length:360 start_codon:yes stop_codon:yes gene_type:complete